MRMSDYLTKTLSELVSEITADGKIDAQEVNKIRERIFADGKIDQEEAEFLFDLNDATTNNDASWQDLFVEAIAQYLLGDVDSPGEIDEAEAEWLISKIEKDGEYDETEKALLKTLKNRATAINSQLQFRLDLHKI